MTLDATPLNDADQDQSLDDHHSEVNFALVLSRVIDQVRSDPSQLRNTVYELARVALEKETERNPPPSPEEKERLKAALEVAIKGVERFSSREVAAYLPPYGGNGAYPVPARLRDGDRWVGSPDIMLGAPERVIVIDSPAASQGQGKFRSVLIRSLVAPLLAAVAAVVVGVGILAVTDRNQAPVPKSAAVETAASSPALPQNSPGTEPFAAAQKAASDPQLAGIPLPTVYGVYALSGEQLHELAVLTERVPDPRVRISTPILAPSRTVLADGRVTFLVFRRDFSSNAPDRISVRTVAKVSRTLRFEPAGAAATDAPADMWAIRSTAYEFRVAPLKENVEMFLLRPEQADFALPAGRYVLVLKGQGYDFTVAGQVTDPSQCLERVDAANGTFYSECRAP